MLWSAVEGVKSVACHQPCPPDDRRPPRPSQNLPEPAPPILLLALLTTAMPFGAPVMLASTCCSLGCAVPQGPWKSCATFGRRGVSHHSAYHSSHPTPSLPLRAAIEEEYAKRLAKLTKVTLGRDEIGYVVLLSSSPPLPSLPDAAAHT
jgi:hypothetical protein